MIRGFRFTLFALLLLAAPPVRADSDNAFTDYDKIVEAAFPPMTMEKKNTAPSARESRYVNSVRDAVIQIIETAGPVWLSAITYPERATGLQFKGMLEIMRKTPVWICNENCSGCSFLGPLGCTTGKKRGETVTAVLFLNRCFFSSVCTESRSPVTMTPSDLFRFMADSMAQIAIYKYSGVTTNDKEQKERVAAAYRTLSVSMSAVSAMGAACPGPFPDSAVPFLRGTGHFRDLGPFAEQCGKKMTDALKADPLPNECKYSVDRAKWEKVVKKGILWEAPVALRCDGLCEVLTCATKGSEAPRLMQFGMRWYLSLPEGACDGAAPSDTRGFVEQVVRMTAKTEVLTRGDAATFIEACARALAPQASKPVKRDGDGATGGAPAPATDTPGVELIE